MIRAGALYYAIFVSLVFTIITGFLIFYAYLTEGFIDQQIASDQLKDDMESVINIALSEPEQIPYAKSVNYEFTHTVSKVSLQKTRWGVYDLLTTKAVFRDIKKKKKVMVGENIFLNENFALYLTDRQKYLSVSGNTRLVGDCLLPKLGVKKAYIEGQGYDEDQTVFGAEKKSKDHIRPFNSKLLKHLAAQLQKSLSKNDSVLFFKDLPNKRSISNSFYNQTLILYVEEPVEISGITLKGNILLLSEAPVTLSGNTTLENVLVFAPEIQVKEGFGGTFQGFASRKIKVADRCDLHYPSFLGVIRQVQKKQTSLSIGKNTNIHGGIFLVNANPSSDGQSKLFINDGAKITGQVYCQGAVQHKGIIEGTLYCHKFFLNTPSTLYENHLLNATINFRALSESFCGADIVQGIDNGQVIMRLN